MERPRHALGAVCVLSAAIMGFLVGGSVAWGWPVWATLLGFTVMVALIFLALSETRRNRRIESGSL